MAVLAGAIHVGKQKSLLPFESEALLVRVAAAG
jgi:hypothetical protein